MYAATDTTAHRRHQVTGPRAFRRFPASTGSWSGAFAGTGTRHGIHAVVASLKPTIMPVNDHPTRRGAPPH